MRKTTVYLADDEADALKRKSAATGTSQAELIREGVRLVTRQTPARVFHSMGRGSGPPYRPVDPDELYAWVMGDRSAAVPNGAPGDQNRDDGDDGPDPGR